MPRRVPSEEIVAESGTGARTPAVKREGLGRARDLLEPLTQWRVPTPILGLLVALATWSTTFNYPTAGLDSSWGGGLYMALQDGLDFGSEVVFTYGPLGFLNISVNWDTTLMTLTFCWLAFLHIMLACGIVWSLRRSFGGVVATVGAFLAVALLTFVEIAFPLATFLCFAALARNRPRLAVLALIVVGSSLAAILSLIKLSIGPPVFVLILIALIGARVRAWQIGAYLSLFVLQLTLLWVVSGQGLSQLPEYVTNGRQIISGYSEAMLYTGGSPLEQGLALAGALLAAVGLAVGAAFASYRDNRARWAGVTVAALVGFALFKEGVVRMDNSHVSLYFQTVALVWLSLPWSHSKRLLLGVGAAALCAVAIPVAVHSRPSMIVDAIDVPSTVDRALTQFDDLLDTQHRSDSALFVQAVLQNQYDVDDEILGELKGHTVSIDPAEIGVVWAYDLDWSPLPVFQNYSAYTAELDELNADEISSPSGPERILRGAVEVSGSGRPALAIDGRYPGWDPPAQAIATLCNFEVLRATSRWQVLGRVPPRCAKPEPIGSVDSSFGETVEVPQAGPGEVVFVRVEGAEVSGFESLRTLLYRAKARFAVVNGNESYRLVPGTSADGLMLNGDARLTGTGLFARAPQAKTLSLTGSSGDLRYDFYSMKVVDLQGDQNERG